MTINQPIAALPSGLPELALLTEKAASTGSVIVYQPYLDPSQRSQLDAAAVPLDISFNTQATTREYELFLILHQHHEAIGLGDDVFWGLLSSKFEMKSVTSFPSFVTEAEKARAEGADAYLYNPLIGHAAIYSNVWEHSLLGGHPGMDPIFLHIQALGHPIAPPQDKTAFMFCNYFCGNRKFWSGYFAFCERILESLEREALAGSPAGTAYAGVAHYSRDANAKMRPFVIERLLGLYVQQAAASGMKIAAFVPTVADFEWKFGVRLGRMLHGLFAAKEAFLQSRDQALLTSWQEGRQPLIKQPHLIWGADDPPAWMPRGQFIGRREFMRAYAPQASGASPVPQQPVRTERPAISAAPKIEQPRRNPLQPFAGGWQAHKDRHCIWIVTPANYNHSHAFDEVALGLQGAFEELGGSAPIVRDMNAFAGRAPIIYGGNLLPAEIVSHLPKDSVVINLEQVSEESIWINSRYTSILKSLPVLDYSPRNRENLAAKGIDHAGVLEIGYSRCLSQIKHAPVKDIDVLFYGSMNERRHHILKTLEQGGLKVAHLFNIYGAERDAAIARSKIVINIHHYASGVFEIVRISYLLANRVCVLTEGDIRDPDLQPFSGGLAVEPYDKMIERCHKLIADTAERDSIAAKGFAAMESRSQAAMLMSVMTAGCT
ncbi:glycosyltransferase family 1 protein [Rhizobium leguminosarum]